MPSLGDLVFPRFPLFCGKFEIVLFFLPVSCYNIGTARYCRKASTPSPEGFFGRKIGMTETIHRRKPVYPFAPGLGFYKIFWVFFLGCIIGVVVETFWCLITKFYIENRSGVIYGPFNPVYGFGAVLLTILSFALRRHHAKGWQVFLASAVIGGLLEQLAGWSMSTLFDAESWTYLHLPDHISQWVAWRFLVMWGLLGLVWCRAVTPRLLYQIGMPTTRRQAVFVALVAVYLVADVAMTLVCFNRKTERDAGVPPSNAFEQWVDTNYSDEFIAGRFQNLKIGKDRDLVDENGNLVMDESGSTLTKGDAS